MNGEGRYESEREREKEREGGFRHFQELEQSLASRPSGVKTRK